MYIFYYTVDLICHSGCDIIKRSSKSKGSNSIMISLPNQLSFVNDNMDGLLGYLDFTNQDNPSLIIDTYQGKLTFEGKFQNTSTKFLNISFSKNCVVDNIIDKVLVFNDPVFKANDISDRNESNEKNAVNEEKIISRFGMSSKSCHNTSTRKIQSMKSSISASKVPKVILSSAIKSNSSSQKVKKSKLSDSEESLHSDADASDNHDIFDLSQEEVNINIRRSSRPSIKATSQYIDVESNSEEEIIELEKKRKPTSAIKTTKKQKQQTKDDDTEDESIFNNTDDDSDYKD